MHSSPFHLAPRFACLARTASLGTLLTLCSPLTWAQLPELSIESAWQPGTLVSFATASSAPMPPGAKSYLFVSPTTPATPINFGGVELVVDPATMIAIPLPAQPHLWTPTAPTEERWHREFKLPSSMEVGLTLYMQAVILSASGVFMTQGLIATTEPEGEHEYVFSISSTEYNAAGQVKFNVIDADDQSIVVDQMSSAMPLKATGNAAKMIGTPTKSTDGKMAAATFVVKTTGSSGGVLVGSDTLVIHSKGNHLWLAQPPTNKAWKRIGPPRFRPGDDSVLWVVEQFWNGDSGCFGGNGIDYEHDLVAYDPWTGQQVQRFQIEYSGTAGPGQKLDPVNWTFDATGSYACFTMVQSHVCTSPWARMRCIPFNGSLTLGAPIDLTVHVGATSVGNDTPMLPIPDSTKVLMTVTANPSASNQTQPTYLVDVATGAVSLPVLGIGTQSTVGTVSRAGDFFVRIHKDASQGGRIHAFGIPAVLAPGASLPLLGTYTIENYGPGTPAAGWVSFYNSNSFVPSLDGSIVYGPRSSWGGWMYRLSAHVSGIPEQTRFDPYFNSGAVFHFDHAPAPRGTACGVGLRTKNLVLTSSGSVGSTGYSVAGLNVTTMTTCDMTPVSLDAIPQGTASIDLLNHSYTPSVVRL